MFVTSDFYDLQRHASFMNDHWSEFLSSGIDLYGTQWPGYTSCAKFLVEVAAELNLLEYMQYGGYNLQGDYRTRPLSPKTLAKDAAVKNKARETKSTAALLTGTMNCQKTPGGKVFVGGDLTTDIPHGAIHFSGSFTYPFEGETRLEIAKKILSWAANSLNCIYGYYHVRDEWVLPNLYGSGISSVNLVSSLDNSELNEIRDWSKFMRSNWWSKPRPPLRDIYEVNLVCESQLAREVSGEKLIDWIKLGNRGTVEMVAPERYLWVLTADQMYHIRPALMDANVILARYERVWRHRGEVGRA